MKKLFFLFIYFPVIYCTAQHPFYKKQEIIIMTGKNQHITRIREEMQIGYATLSSHQYNEGIIERISRDTIFIGKTYVRIYDLMLITNPLFVSVDVAKHPESYVGMGVIYRNDTSNWKIFCPPEDAYTSGRKYNQVINAYRAADKYDKQQRNFKPVKNNYLLLNLTRLLNFDIALSYERKISRSISLSTEMGYKIATGQGPSLFDAFYAFAQSGPSLIIGPKFYFGKNIYLSPLFHLKYLEIHSSTYKEPFSDENPTLMDQYETLSGVSTRLGVLAHAGSFWLDFYLGAGIKYTSAYEVMYCYYSNGATYYFNTDGEPELQNFYEWHPIVNLGIKIGIGFK